MREYLLGVATVPTVALVGWVVLMLAVRTSTFALSCGCGKDWGNPKERGWRWWWKPIVLRVHDLGHQHRAWWNGDGGQAYRARRARLAASADSARRRLEEN